MILKSTLILGAVLILSGSSAVTVVLSGTAQDCFAGSTVPVGGVTVSAFQVSKARKLVTQLKAMDQATFPAGDYTVMSKFETQYSQMIALVNSTNALARGTSAANGAFSLSVTAVDSVLVVGYEAMEDEPYYYSYKTIAGRSNISFALDMSRGTCSR